MEKIRNLSPAYPRGEAGIKAPEAPLTFLRAGLSVMLLEIELESLYLGVLYPLPKVCHWLGLGLRKSTRLWSCPDYGIRPQRPDI